jgi:hypothetical protein
MGAGGFGILDRCKGPGLYDGSRKKDRRNDGGQAGARSTMSELHGSNLMDCRGSFPGPRQRSGVSLDQPTGPVQWHRYRARKSSHNITSRLPVAGVGTAADTTLITSVPSSRYPLVISSKAAAAAGSTDPETPGGVNAAETKAETANRGPVNTRTGLCLKCSHSRDSVTPRIRAWVASAERCASNTAWKSRVPAKMPACLSDVSTVSAESRNARCESTVA